MPVDVGDGLLDDVVGAIIQFPKNQRIGEGLIEALVVDHWAIDTERCSSFVLIVEDSLREKLLEACDVLVGDVLVEGRGVRLERALPESVEVCLW